MLFYFQFVLETSHGFTHMQTTTKDGVRFSTAKAFLKVKKSLFYFIYLTLFDVWKQFFS
jgi:hypothetical protein